MSRLVVISNRVSKPGPGKAVAGGLAVGVQAALEDQGGLWFGWSGKTCDTEPGPAAVEEQGNVKYATIELNENEYEQYYNGFSNTSLWPVFHYLLAYFNFDRHAFEAYWRVNSVFARKLLPLLQPDDIIWVHDYHLIPLVTELREAGVTNPIGFFLHIPFPDFDMLRVLPPHRSLLKAMCQYDLVGFHTEGDRRNFVDSAALADIGAEAISETTLSLHGRNCHAGVYPIGVDVDGVAAFARGSIGSNQITRLHESLVSRQLIVGVDRLDYSKGLPERFKAFERLLEKYPTNRCGVTYMQIAPPTRTGVRDYDDIRNELEQTAGHINGRFSTPDWVPIRYLNSNVPREQLMGMFRLAHVGLVTPVRDGMNLVAKEYVASQSPEDPGMLVLSRLAGAAAELEEAVLVNPYDVDSVADGIEQALSMSKAERQQRHQAMLATLRKNDITAWRTRFVDDLQQASSASQSKPDAAA